MVLPADDHARVLTERHAVGRRILELRLARGVTQERLGERVRLDRRTISETERGMRDSTLGDLTRIAAALDVPTWTLLWDRPDSAMSAPGSPGGP
ncbi:helix-turn-helix domain-containing protein [Kitasatospora sp. MBT63]|uniref:helix-turn-helix domain-containing protein n=1 Tax=Kitasatospora sp. MBT63 TaxID=1444768 RepID=UPI0007C6E05B|nr:helix-turn-helix transcriptional regulator [Kitasatospora sp. MBT63]